MNLPERQVSWVKHNKKMFVPGDLLDIGTGHKTVTVFRVLPKWHTHSVRWIAERDGGWNDVAAPVLVLACVNGFEKQTHRHPAVTINSVLIYVLGSNGQVGWSHVSFFKQVGEPDEQ